MERRDFFISYTKKDTEQALWIANVLKSHGYTVYIQQLDIKPGDNFLEKMNEFLKNCDNFLAVWSEAYSKSRYCKTEIQAAFNEWNKERINGFLPICIEDYPMEPLYAAIVHVDLFGMDEASAEKKLMDTVYSVAPHTQSESDTSNPEDIAPKELDPSNSENLTPKESDTPIKSEHIQNTSDIKFILLGAIIYVVGFLIFASVFGAKQYQMGYNYHYGVNGVEQDYTKALKYYKQAAGWGNPDALFELGYLYQTGEGVEQNYAKAREYYEKAADKGSAAAMNNLGQLYSHGWGVKRNYFMARVYYEEAAEKGNKVALYNLGGLYEYGLGILTPKDYYKAMEYYQESVDRGYEPAVKKVEELREKLYG